MIDLALTDDIMNSSIIDEAIQELDILFNTTPTELIGDTSYGSNFLKFLWSLTPMEDSLRNYVLQLITANTLYASALRHEVNVEKYDDVNETVYVIEVILYDDADNKYSKTYTIS